MGSGLVAREHRGGDRFLAFRGVPGTVRLDSCAELLDPLQAVLGAWPATNGERRSVPFLSVSRCKSGYRIEAFGEDAIELPMPASAVCRLAADLAAAFVDADPDLLCLHSGAAAIGGRLVVFPSTYRAGKSTLLAGLAAAGVTIHADDVLPLDGEGRGLSLAVAPRLRLPLPPQAGSALRRFAARHAGPSDDRYLYLSLPPGLTAEFGSRRPIGDFVLLERKEGAVARLFDVAPERMLAALVGRNFAEGHGAPAILARLKRLVLGRGCFRLVYDWIDEAADLLKHEFAEAGRRGATAGEPDAPAPNPNSSPVCIPRRARFRRRSDVACEALGGAQFLADPRGGTIVSLNPLAAGLWVLLEEPMSAVAATALIAAAFPEEDRRRLARDVGKLFDELFAAGMIVQETKAPRRSSGARYRPKLACRVSRI